MTIDIKQLRKDMEAGTQGEWEFDPPHGTFQGGFVSGKAFDICDFGDSETYYPTEGTPPSDVDARRIARLPELEREYIALREAADQLAETLEWAEDVAVTQAALVEFYATSIKALAAYRKATE